MSDSIAVWVAPLDGGEISEKKCLDLHLNYWKLPRSKEDFLDIGIYARFGEYSINISLPFVTDVKDLSESFKEIAFCELLFNESLEIESGNKEAVIRFKKNSGEKEAFSVVHVVKFPEQENQTREDRTRLSIKLDSDFWELYSAQGEKHSVYFRIRTVLPRKNSPIISINKPVDRAFRSGYLLGDLIHIKVNHRAKHDFKEDSEKLSFIKGSSCIRKLHFLIACQAECANQNSQFPHSSCRLLENEVWEGYLKHPDTSRCPITSKDKMLVYHFKKEEGTEGYSMFVKLGYEHTDIPRIIIFVVVVIMINIVSNFLTVHLA